MFRFGTVYVSGSIYIVSCIRNACGVYLEGDYRCTDNYFDLLPGEGKTLAVSCPEDTALEIKIVK